MVKRKTRLLLNKSSIFVTYTCLWVVPSSIHYRCIMNLSEFINNFAVMYNYHTNTAYTGTSSIGCFKIYCCEILHGQSFLYKLYISDTHLFNVFLRDSGEMTSIMAPALSNLIIKSNVGARSNSKSAYSPLFFSNF